MSSAKWRPFCLGLNVLNVIIKQSRDTFLSCNARRSYFTCMALLPLKKLFEKSGGTAPDRRFETAGIYNPHCFSIACYLTWVAQMIWLHPSHFTQCGCRPDASVALQCRKYKRNSSPGANNLDCHQGVELIRKSLGCNVRGWLEFRTLALSDSDVNMASVKTWLCHMIRSARALK